MSEEKSENQVIGEGYGKMITDSIEMTGVVVDFAKVLHEDDTLYNVWHEHTDKDEFMMFVALCAQQCLLSMFMRGEHTKPSEENVDTIAKLIDNTVEMGKQASELLSRLDPQIVAMFPKELQMFYTNMVMAELTMRKSAGDLVTMVQAEKAGESGLSS